MKTTLTMNGEIKFSICIPNYNYQDYVLDTINSVLSQTYQNFEILIADNASTDNSVDMIRSIKDDRIKLLVNNYNIGFAPNLDKAASLATGDYMIMLSSDDRMKPDALLTYYNILIKHGFPNNKLVLCSATDIIDSDNNVVGSKQAMNNYLLKNIRLSANTTHNNEQLVEGHTLIKAVLQGSLISIGQFLTTCYPRSLYQKVEGYNSTMSVKPDAHFSHKIMWENPKVIFVDKTLFQYRVHNQGNYASINQSIKLIADGYQLTQLYSESLLSKLGMSAHQLRKNFVKHNLSNAYLMAIFQGTFSYLFKVVAFLWAAYPKITRKNWLGWIYPIALPFLVTLCFFNNIRKMFKKT